MDAPTIRRLFTVVAASCALATAGCAGGSDGGGWGSSNNQDSGQDGGGETNEQEGSNAGQQYPDIEDVQVEKTDETTADLSVTVSSPYDTPERYADGWRVLDQDDEVLGEHTLMHDHEDEQPFTRTQSGVTIPAGTQELTIEGRDLENGYGGETVTVDWD